MTSPDSPSPRTEAGKRLDTAWPGTHLDRLDWNDAIRAIEAEAGFAPKGDNHHNAAKCPYCSPAAQEAPAPEGLRAALERIAEVLDQSGGDRYAIEARSIARAALATTPPTPAEPPNPWPVLEADPTFREGMAKAAAERERGEFAPVVHRAEARPPEGLDGLSAAATPGPWSFEALTEDGWALIGVTPEPLGADSGPERPYGYGEGVTWSRADAAFIVAAVNYVRARLSAGGATTATATVTNAAPSVTTEPRQAGTYEVGTTEPTGIVDWADGSAGGATKP